VALLSKLTGTTE